MVKEQLAWYEAQIVKDLMANMGGKALRGIMTNIFSARIYLGKLAFFQVSNLLAANLKESERRALIIVDDFTQKFTTKVETYLKMKDFNIRIWAGAKPEAPLPTIEKAAKICEEFKPMVICAIGGGSVMDTAKMVIIKYEKPNENLFMILPFFNSLGLRTKFKYFITIPTTSGTGSEVTQAAVATDVEKEPPKKLEIINDEIVSDITILDTDFVKDMPPFLTMATGLDAFSHALGSYVSSWGSPYIDAMNYTAIKEVLKYLPRAYKYGTKDIEARSHMQMAATMAGVGFGNTIAGIDHALGHSFGKVFNVHHGLSVGLFAPYSLAFQYKVTDRWKELLPLFDIKEGNKSRVELFDEFIMSVKNFIESVNGVVNEKIDF
ncbi:MAG: iron-containing alcohol dehydrogenase [Candidatus Lokiarchaeota archaeon]